MECIFCMIASHNAEAKIIYEDDAVIAFLDANPVSDGHTLVIPKKHYEDIFGIDTKTIERIAAVTKKITKIYNNSLGIDAVNLLNASGRSAQQSVFHFHLHIIPRHENDGLDLWFHGDHRNNSNIDEMLKKIS